MGPSLEPMTSINQNPNNCGRSEDLPCLTFPCCIIGQVWYKIVSFPDLCPLSYFNPTVWLWLEAVPWVCRCQSFYRAGIIWYNSLLWAPTSRLRSLPHQVMRSLFNPLPSTGLLWTSSQIPQATTDLPTSPQTVVIPITTTLPHFIRNALVQGKVKSSRMSNS